MDTAKMQTKIKIGFQQRHSVNKGFTLIEAVVSFFILLVMFLYILELYATGKNVFLKSRFRTEAVKLAQETLENERVASPPSVSTSCTSSSEGSNYLIEFYAEKPSSLTAIPNSTKLGPDSMAQDNLFQLMVVVSGPFVDSNCNKLHPGNVRVELVTLVARQMP